MRALLLSVVLGALFAIVGPRIVGPQDRAAGGPFVYEPPEGFAPFAGSKKAEAQNAKVWVAERPEQLAGGAPSARIILNHSSKVMSVDEVDLARLAIDMPTAFTDCTWTHRRHEMRTRVDGARVGLIEGDCTHAVALGAFGLPDKKIQERKLQLVFPDDTGTSIVTASYPIEQGPQWEPLVEATIGKAHGVATRVPAQPAWIYLAWAVAGAVLGWFIGALADPRRASARRTHDTPSANAEAPE